MEWNCACWQCKDVHCSLLLSKHSCDRFKHKCNCIDHWRYHYNIGRVVWDRLRSKWQTLWCSLCCNSNLDHWSIHQYHITRCISFCWYFILQSIIIGNGYFAPYTETALLTIGLREPRPLSLRVCWRWWCRRALPDESRRASRMEIWLIEVLKRSCSCWLMCDVWMTSTACVFFLWGR